MDTWLGPGVVVTGTERAHLLSRLRLSAVTTGSARGALVTRTALVEQSSGPDHVRVRVAGRGLAGSLMTDPRVVLSATTHLGGRRFAVVDGLAHVRLAEDAGDGLELLLLDVAVDRVECWTVERVRRPSEHRSGAKIPGFGTPRLVTEGGEG